MVITEPWAETKQTKRWNPRGMSLEKTTLRAEQQLGPKFWWPVSTGCGGFEALNGYIYIYMYIYIYVYMGVSINGGILKQLV